MSRLRSLNIILLFCRSRTLLSKKLQTASNTGTQKQLSLIILAMKLANLPSPVAFTICRSHDSRIEETQAQYWPFSAICSSFFPVRKRYAMAPRLKIKFFLNSSGVQSVSSSPLSQNSGFSCPIPYVTTCFFSAASGYRNASKCSTFSAFLWKQIHSGTMMGAGWTPAISLTPSSKSLNN